MEIKPFLIQLLFNKKNNIFEKIKKTDSKKLYQDLILKINELKDITYFI